MAAGDIVGFSSDLEAFTRLADDVHQPFHRYHATVMRAAQALYLGRFDEADELARDALAMGKRMPGMDASGAYGMQMFSAVQARGQLASLAPKLEHFVRTTPTDAMWRLSPSSSCRRSWVGSKTQGRDSSSLRRSTSATCLATVSGWLAWRTWRRHAF